LAFFDGRAVYECPIPAIQITDLITAILTAEHTVPPRNGRIADGEQIGWVASDGKLALGKRKNRILQRSRDYLKPWVHLEPLPEPGVV
jgi:hypothetical protein